MTGIIIPVQFSGTEQSLEQTGRPPQGPEDRPMDNYPTRAELGAELRALEANQELRARAIEGKIDGLTTLLGERSKAADERTARLEASISDTLSSIGSLKSAMIVTAISTVLAIVLGVAAFNATVLSNMVASFESGKNTVSSQVDLKRQTEETATLLKQMQQQMQQQQRAAEETLPPAKPKDF